MEVGLAVRSGVPGAKPGLWSPQRRTIDGFKFSKEHKEELSVPSQRLLESIQNESADERECKYALVTLTELLAIKYGETPWVLIDEYDAVRRESRA